MVTIDRAAVLGECQQIQENSTYNAETHFQLASELSDKAKFYKAVPIIATAIFGFISLFDLPRWVNALTILSALMAMLSVVMEPEKRAASHTQAGKFYTALKHDARFLWEVVQSSLTDELLLQEVKALQQRYNTLAQITPATSDDAFMKARAKIQAGIHEPD